MQTTQLSLIALNSLTAPATIFVFIFLIFPLGMMMRYSFNRYDPFDLMISMVTLENYAKFFSDSFYQEVLWRTVWISTISTAICLVAGIPVAYFLARYASSFLKRVLLILVLIPLLVGNVVRTSAWMLILDDSGVLAAFLRLFGYNGPLGLMYSSVGILIGLISVLLPFMIITLNSVFENIDNNLELAAESLGANHLTVLRRVVLPLSLPGVAAGSVLCFILAMNAYATPVLIGGPRITMMAPIVYQQIAQAMNWPFGSALAFLMMITTVLLTIAGTTMVQSRYKKWNG